MELKFYHPNNNGNGSAVQFTISGNKKGEPVVFVFFAKQNSVKQDRSSKCFDWKNKIGVMLDVEELAAVAVTLETGGTEWKALHTNGNKKTNITLQKNDKGPGFKLGIYVMEGDQKNMAMIFLKDHELWLVHRLAENLANRFFDYNPPYKNDKTERNQDQRENDNVVTPKQVVTQATTQVQQKQEDDVYDFMKG